MLFSSLYFGLNFLLGTRTVDSTALAVLGKCNIFLSSKAFTCIPLLACRYSFKMDEVRYFFGFPRNQKVCKVCINKKLGKMFSSILKSILQNLHHHST